MYPFIETNAGLPLLMFGIPAETEFDIRFRLFGVPTRITPFFWVGAALIGSNQSRNGSVFIMWILAVLVSIMVHEFGHALTARYFGERPSVILYEMGGLCTSDQTRHSVWKRLLILIMGPGAGFLFFGLLIVGLSAFFRISPLQVLDRDLSEVTSLPLRSFFYFLISINLFWGLVNLLPVYPLDGGQISAILLSLFNRQNGLRWSFVLSLLCSGLVAIYMAQRNNYLGAVMFGLLGFRSYQALQALQDRGRYEDSYDSDADWWKR